MPLPTLEEMLKMVAAACLTGGETAEQTKILIQQSMLTPDAPPKIQDLGRGLTRVLDGQRGAAATAGLPEDVAELVDVVLHAVEEQTGD